MKFLGEFIQHFVSRFRNDVFLEDISSGTIASGGNLGLDSNNKIVKANVPADGDITSVGFTVDGSNTHSVDSGDVNFSILGGEGINTAISTTEITISGEFASVTNKGIASFSSSNFDVSSGVVTIKSGGVDLTDEVTGILPVANGGTGLNSISTLLNSNVTDISGNAATATALTSGDKTISGDLTVTSGTSGDATLIISADTDDSDESDSPRLWFKADGDITEGAIQHKDNTFDIISNVSANGGIRFLTGTTNNTGTTDPETGATERMSISSAGVVTVAGALQPNTIELGHASDTTISRVNAGTISVEGETVVTTKTTTVTSGADDHPIATLIGRRTLTTAEMNDLHNTPIEIAPAPGANIVALPTGGMIRVDRASTNSGGGSLDFHYNGVTASYGTTSLIHFRRFNNGKTTDGIYNIVPNTGGVLTSTNLTDDVNSAIEVSLSSACTTNCFTSVDIYLTYQLIKIA